MNQISSCQLVFYHIRYLGGVQAPSSHGSIAIETPLTSEANWENGLSIAPMGLTDLKFNQPGLREAYS
jgi:hypothetical protein